MIKPKLCEGCPLAYNKAGFVADYIPQGAKIVAVMDVPATNLNGDSADETYDAKLFDREFRQELKGEEVGWSHLIRCKQGKVGGKIITGKKFKEAVQHCRVHDSFGERVLVTLGAAAWKFFSKMKPSKKNSRRDWRGFFCVVKEYDTDLNFDIGDILNEGDDESE